MNWEKHIWALVIICWLVNKSGVINILLIQDMSRRLFVFMLELVYFQIDFSVYTSRFFTSIALPQK